MSDDAVERLLRQYWTDRASGEVRPVREYLDILASTPGDPKPTADASECNDTEHEPIGPYQPLSEIGRGGQGIVYLAMDTRLNRRVALKVLSNLGPVPETLLHRFRREAEIASKLDHPGICSIHDAGIDGGIPFIAMQYVEGKSLADRIKVSHAPEATGPSPSIVDMEGAEPGEPRTAPDSEGDTTTAASVTRAEIGRVLQLFEKVARALHAAHEAGVVHRDVKPANIVIGSHGDPVILDFGLARLDGDATRSLTRSSDIFGTPAYMSPEQISDGGHVDRRADVWSLGVALYEALTLRRPFESPTRDALYRSILTEDPPDPLKLNPRLPPELKVVLGTALEKDRDHRYQSAEELALELERIRSFRPILARAPGAWLRMKRWAQRNPATATGLVALFVLLVSGLCVMTWFLSETRAVLARERRALAAYDRISDELRLEQLVDTARTELWPPTEENIPAMSAWLDRARRMAEMMPELESDLASLTSGPGAQKSGDLWKQQRLVAFIAALDALTSDDTTGDTIAAVEARLAFARSVRQRSLVAAAPAWRDAAAAIAASPRYSDLRLQPQLGLVPLGADPDSGLWEFAHLQTGAVPLRDPTTGRLGFVQGSSIVLVLLPGGRSTMGSQNEDENAPYFDEKADADLMPCKVQLDPFFISKYEVTQDQWSRVLGSNPSGYGAGYLPQGGRVHTSPHPVEQVSWADGARALWKLGLQLPTEAQWEYAGRGGTTTQWWTGKNRRSLIGAANLADQAARRWGNAWVEINVWIELDDGFGPHAPVGSFRANPFGLHDMTGNVWEWCEDWYGSNSETMRPRPGDGLRGRMPRKNRVLRGGSFRHSADEARSAVRENAAPTYRATFIGLRPVRRVTPPQ